MGTSRKSNSSSNGESKQTTRKRTTSNQSESRRGSRSYNKQTTTSPKLTQEEIAEQSAFHDEIILVITLVSSILVVLANFGMGGFLGGAVNRLLLGIFGTIAYAIPVAAFVLVAFHISNRGNKRATRKIITGIILMIALMAFFQMISKQYNLKIFECYSYGRNHPITKGVSGGFIGGIICKMLTPLVGTVGAYVIIIALFLIGFMIFTGKTLVTAFSKRSGRFLNDMKNQYQENAALRQEYHQKKIEEREVSGDSVQEDSKGKKRRAKTFDLKPKEYEVDEQTGEIKDDPLNQSKKNNNTVNDIKPSVDMEEIQPNMDHLKLSGNYISSEEYPSYENELKQKFGTSEYDGQAAQIQNSLGQEVTSILETNTQEQGMNEKLVKMREMEHVKAEPSREANVHIQALPIEEPTPRIEDEMDGYPGNSNGDYDSFDTAEVDAMDHEFDAEEKHVKGEHTSTHHSKSSTSHHATHTEDGQEVTAEDIKKQIEKIEDKPYVFPPFDLLARPRKNVKGMTDHDLKETASKLQKTLESFGVRATITNVTCGPSVTRYEIQPEQGVKVSTITKLSDDIKLNLAATDIRIEAPIPGKAAVGIEVPNKENSAVMFRELIENKEFMEHPSDIAFAVGKDISGQSIISDIGKMPHLLIAGATGSGKSVCINTLIMSILYKADPKDVKLIMVDPKVVELSVYNGIPHLMIPVVTDPKMASSALNWAVVEMEERYRKFAELGVREVKSYNAKIKQVEFCNDERFKKMPQIVIIVDELADLMMVAKGDVEEAICRLAQKARAAGIHLVIATQRPSVNVITGLIKANVPSRIAFAVSSAIDSRTIIDGAGAEKLLGKGDMLFLPQGYPKPVRLQGAFISDKEVGAVVDFISRENGSPVYSNDVANHISSGSSEDGSPKGSNSDRDEYFAQAGKYIIEKDKASIGMLQRVYKIGFNRAARIMDQLCEAGVVGPEEGTKPRKVLMSMEEFDQYVEDYV